MLNRIEIEGLTELRAALRAAQGRAPRELTAALKKGGEPIIRRAAASMPRRSGRLASSLTTRVAGVRADIVSRVAYAGGAEWGMFGPWQGWARTYGGAPRFVSPAVDAEAENAMRIIAEELEDVLTAQGWFREGSGGL